MKKGPRESFSVWPADFLLRTEYKKVRIQLNIQPVFISTREDDMASGNFKGTWVIWVLFIIAVVFAFFAFNKPKPAAQSQQPQSAAAQQVQPVLPSQAAVPPESTAGIKPDHSPKDMKDIATKKATSAVVMPPHEVAAIPTFAVQVYSFKEKTRAEAALKALKDKNYKAYIMVSDLGPRGIWYRVRVGSFSAEAEVQRALESITRDFKSGIIVTE